MLYSVKMRAAQGGPHEHGGRHISGAERLVPRDKITETTHAMLERAFSHSRGRADFINIKVEAIANESIVTAPLLPVVMTDVCDVPAGRAAAEAALVEAGVSPLAARCGIDKLLALEDSLRGAMLLCAKTGKRLDDKGRRGIRVSRMDITDNDAFDQWLKRHGLAGTHVREALVLASKVMSAPGILAELCWSDDPEYTTGYVSSKKCYLRLPKLKPFGSPIGGRVFFVKPDTDLSALIEYLENQPALITIDETNGDRHGLYEKLS